MENKFNILVCDDDKSIVDAIEIYLKQENYNVIKAYNGLEALQALEENEIHLILLDVMMPKMDGLNTTVKIRETLNIPIIILSAKSEDTDKILGLNFGADDYITKPFNAGTAGKGKKPDASVYFFGQYRGKKQRDQNWWSGAG